VNAVVDSAGSLQRVALVRHGETGWNAARRLQGHVDRPLNETGLAQASAVAERLTEWLWSHVVTSPLIRAVQTAVTIANRDEPGQLTICRSLIEQSFGRADGLHIDEAARR
jgi:broad specificity phosphatase PhoE